MAAMAPWMWFVGLRGDGAAVLRRAQPDPAPDLLLGGVRDVTGAGSERKTGAEGNAAYYRVKPAHRWLVGGVYVGLIVALAVGMDLTHVARTFADA